ncbi:MAG: hypothetical protein KTR26_00175 [Flammeovirgaceae bacterium]|nr:hypothetical protein [Flammeovirgaceae bacterium]
MEKVSEKDLSRIFEQWFYQPGQPKLQLKWKFNKKEKKPIVTITQLQAGNTYQTPIEISIDSKNAEGNLTESIHKIELKEGVQTFEISPEHPPKEIILDPNHWLLFSE